MDFGLQGSVNDCLDLPDKMRSFLIGALEFMVSKNGV